MTPEAVERLMWRRLHSSGLGRWVDPGTLTPELSWPLTPRVEGLTLRAQLAREGWVDDPAPRLRARTKPFVSWSLRERRAGPALHLEQQSAGLFVHLDVVSPGTRWWLFPAHLLVDYRGWSTTRVGLIYALAAMEQRLNR